MNVMDGDNNVLKKQFEEDGFVRLPRKLAKSDVEALLSALDNLSEGEPGGPGLRHVLTRSPQIKRFAKSSQLLGITALTISWILIPALLP